jgi:hypothetical protein
MLLLQRKILRATKNDTDLIMPLTGLLQPVFIRGELCLKHALFLCGMIQHQIPAFNRKLLF